MSIKLIALDLDGTLMLPDHITVSERNKAALLKAHESGIKTVISTGRTLSVITHVIKQIPFVDYVMYSDGAALYDVKSDKVIYEKLIDYDITKQIIEHLNTTNVYYNIYLDGKIATQKGRERLYNNNSLPQEFINDYIKNTLVCDDLLDSVNGKGAELIVGFFNTEKEYNDSMSFIKAYESKLYVTSAFEKEFEMTNIEATKGKTMDYICKKDGLTAAEVMAIGDSLNDLPMLEFAGVSVAMGNADEKVKQKVDYITDTNANDGVAKAIKKYVFEKAV